MADWGGRRQDRTPVMNPITVGSRSSVSGRNSRTIKMSKSEEMMLAAKKSPMTVFGGFFAVLVLFYWVGGSSNTSTAVGDNVYSVMIDAGSTGSRVHAYHFKTLRGHPVLQSELFQQLKPGLSSFKDDPKGGANSLIPLLDASIERVPTQLHASTPVSLKATAGLRMLTETQANGLLDATRDLLATYPFRFDKKKRRDYHGWTVRSSIRMGHNQLFAVISGCTNGTYCCHVGFGRRIHTNRHGGSNRQRERR